MTSTLASGLESRASASPGALRAIGALAACVPWLEPFVPGPSSAVVPWLVSFFCATGLWCASMLAGGRARPAWLGAGMALVAWGWAWHHASGLDVAAWAAGVVLIVMAMSLGDVRALLDGFGAGTVAAAALSAAIALVQYFGASAALGPWVSAAKAGEAYANLRQPNQFATLCAIGLAWLLWSRPRAWSWALAALLAAGSAASVSRTGLAQLAGLALLVVLWPGDNKRSRILLACVACVSYAVAAWLLPAAFEWMHGHLPERTLWGRMGGGASCSSRSVLWSNVLHLIALRPWVGWGPGELDFAHFTTLYDGARFCDILDNAHNLPLHLAVELGLPAAVLVVAGFLAWAVRSQPWREASPDRQRAWALVAIILLHSLLEYPLWYGPFQLAAGVALGQLAPGGATWRRGVVVAATAVLVACAGAAAWDYARVSQIYLPADRRLAPWRDDPLAQARQSVLFASQGEFASLTLQTPSRANAAEMLPTARRMLHYSPEPRVIERAIEAATYLGRDDEAAQLLRRYRAAFPAEAAAWSQRNQARPQD